MRSVRNLTPGLDLPCWFIDSLKAIDRNFNFVFHQWRLLWEDVMNYETGCLEDPRFCIGYFAERECWGFPLKDNKGDPIPEPQWHVWRHAPDYGWSHVINIASTKDEHLLKIVNTIWENAQMRDMGLKKYRTWKKELQDKELEANEAKGAQKFADLEKENRKLTKDAMENFQYGRVEPTNPTKDIIYSYNSQANKSRITRPITDKEGGLVTWEEEGGR